MVVDDPHRASIERYLAAYNAFDVHGMLGVLHRDVTFENVSQGGHSTFEFRDGFIVRLVDES